MYSLKNISFRIGVDEVGRGPIAGPVTIGAFLVEKNKEKAVLSFFKKVKESKQLSPAQREEWFTKIQEQQVLGNLDFAVSFVSSASIDKLGLSRAIRLSLKRSLYKLGKQPEECEVLLDGLLHAPLEFKHQQTIVGGDESEPLIALASICAKVLRDRRMVRLAKKYPAYDFHIHKGYGTAAHYKKIRQYGMCDIHRRSFLKALK